MSRLANLRRGAAQAGGNGKGKGKGGFFAKWIPPGFEKLCKQMTPQESRTEIQAAEPIVLVQGEYLDPYTLDKATNQPTMGQMFHHHSHRYQRHYKGKPAGYRSATCTAGPDPHNPQPCVPCLLIDQKEMDEKSSGSRSSWVVNAVHLSSYYETQYVKDGQAQTRQDSTPIMIKKECKQGSISQRNYWNYRAQNSNGKESAQCEGCAQGIPHTLGNHRYWELGKGHLNALLDFNEKQLSGTCYYTNTGIVKKGFVCGSCRAPILDIAASQFTNEQIQQFEDATMTCPSCQVPGLPVPDYEAGFDSQFIAKVAGYAPPVDAAGVPIPLRPLDLFDVVLWIQREGEGTKSAPVVKKWERLTQAPFGEGGAPFDLTGMVEALVPEVFDFGELFSTDPDTQAKDLDRANPYAQHQQPGAYPPPAQGGYAPSAPPPPAPHGGYAPTAAPPAGPAYPAATGVPSAAPGVPAPGYAPPPAPAAAPGYPPAPSAAPAGYPAAPGYAPAAPAPAAAPPGVAPPGVGHVPAPYAAPPAAPTYPPPPGTAAPHVPAPAPTAGPQAAPPAAPNIAAPYPQAPHVGAAPAAPVGGPPQPGNRPGWNNQ